MPVEGQGKTRKMGISVASGIASTCRGMQNYAGESNNGVLCNYLSHRKVKVELFRGYACAPCVQCWLHAWWPYSM